MHAGAGAAQRYRVSIARIESLAAVYVSAPHEAWPTYEFAAPILDHLDGVTHVLLSTEFVDQQKQYHWIAEHLGFRKLAICHFP